MRRYWFLVLVTGWAISPLVGVAVAWGKNNANYADVRATEAEKNYYWGAGVNIGLPATTPSISKGGGSACWVNLDKADGVHWIQCGYQIGNGKSTQMFYEILLSPKIQMKKYDCGAPVGNAYYSIEFDPSKEGEGAWDLEAGGKALLPKVKYFSCYWTEAIWAGESVLEADRLWGTQTDPVLFIDMHIKTKKDGWAFVDLTKTDTYKTEVSSNTVAGCEFYTHQDPGDDTGASKNSSFQTYDKR